MDNRSCHRPRQRNQAANYLAYVVHLTDHYSVPRAADRAINRTQALQRPILIAQLHVPTYEEVGADTSATGEAGAVPVATAVTGAVRSLFINGLWAVLAPGHYGLRSLAGDNLSQLR